MQLMYKYNSHTDTGNSTVHELYKNYMVLD